MPLTNMSWRQLGNVEQLAPIARHNELVELLQSRPTVQLLGQNAIVKPRQLLLQEEKVKKQLELHVGTFVRLVTQP
ncbi:MAG TPA: hypothetical protein VK821_14600, partial [Dehalococcoidia bacterium]|nr:hypothetical protein [Dehalococcoidia bacterium]